MNRCRGDFLGRLFLYTRTYAGSNEGFEICIATGVPELSHYTVLNPGYTTSKVRVYKKEWPLDAGGVGRGKCGAGIGVQNSEPAY